MPVAAGFAVAYLQSLGFSPALKVLTRAMEGVTDDSAKAMLPKSYWQVCACLCVCVESISEQGLCAASLWEAERKGHTRAVDGIRGARRELGQVSGRGATAHQWHLHCPPHLPHAPPSSLLPHHSSILLLDTTGGAQGRRLRHHFGQRRLAGPRGAQCGAGSQHRRRHRAQEP